MQSDELIHTPIKTMFNASPLQELINYYTFFFIWSVQEALKSQRRVHIICIVKFMRCKFKCGMYLVVINYCFWFMIKLVNLAVYTFNLYFWPLKVPLLIIMCVINCIIYCSFYDTTSVFVAAGVTCLVCLSLSLFAIQTKVRYG